MYHEATKTFCDIFYIETSRKFFTLTGKNEKIIGASIMPAARLFTGLSYWEAVSKAEANGWQIEKN